MDKLRLAWLFPQGRKLGMTLQDSVRTFFQHAVEGEAHTTTTRPVCGAPGTKACAAQQLLSLLELGWGLPDRSSIQMDANGLKQGPFAVPPIHLGCPFLAQTVMHPNYEL